MPEYPFSLDSTTQPTLTFGSLDPSEDVVFEYKVRIDEKAVIGTNTLKLRETLDGVTWSDHDYNVLVKVTESVLSVSEISTTPEQFHPGEISALDITLKNLASTILKDVTVKLNLETETSTTTGATVADLPFVPVYSTTEKKIRYLEGGEEQTISFNLKTYANAESRVYKVPITISYTDESGNTFSRTDLIGVIVGSEPKLTVLVESSQIRSAGSSGEVVIKFVNKGVTNIKFLNVKVEENELVDVLSTTNEVYIGGIDSDDYDTANFRVKIAKSTGSSGSLPLVIDYMDANNKEYSEKIDLPLSFLSDSELGVETKSPVGTIVFVGIAVVVIGFFIWRRKKRKHHK
jgi:hypothetical protein